MRTVLALLCFWGAGWSFGGEKFEPVSIELRPQAMVRNIVITIDDIAIVRGGSPALQERIRRIDVAEAAGNKTTSISASAIDFRLQLADFPKSSFTLRGAKEVALIPWKETLTEERVIDAARERLVKSLPWPEDDLAIQLARPLTVKMPEVTATDEVSIKTALHSPNQGLGRAQINLVVYLNGERKLDFPVHLEAKLYRKVAIATRPIKAGEEFTESNVAVSRRAMDSTNLQYPLAEWVLGKKAKRNLGPGHVVGITDLEEKAETPTEKPAEVVIKSRQLVKMIVPLGNLNVVAQGEAMQEGKMGQAIRVQNVDSKKVVIGRVTGPNTVEVNPGVSP